MGVRSKRRERGMRAVLDAGPIIHLSWIDRLDLLNVIFEEVFLPAAVPDEIRAAPITAMGLDSISIALQQGLRSVHHVQSSAILPAMLGLGEREAILLAEEIDADDCIATGTQIHRDARHLTRGAGSRIHSVGIILVTRSASARFVDQRRIG